MYLHTLKAENIGLALLVVRLTHYWGARAAPALHDRVLVLQQDQMDHVMPCNTALELFCTTVTEQEQDEGSTVV